MRRPLRVLLCDDSAFARKVLRDVLAQAPSIEVVGTARDGLDALEKIAALRPDVITVDLVMPHLDGLGLLTELGTDGPRAVVVSSSAEDSDLVVRALQAGAITSVQKPTALATDRLYEIGAEVVRAVLLAGDARPATDPAPVPVIPVPVPTGVARVDVVAIGASTGGPRAITRVLESLPASFPAPIVLVVHMPVGYTDAFARRLDETCALEVIEAHDGIELRPGRVVIARAGMHLVVGRTRSGLVGRLDVQPLGTAHRPSVDVLFQSAATAGRVLGVVLTGMGNDGTSGARAIRAAGGEVIVESASSCVVYGMPRSVVEAGLASGDAPIDGIAALIIERAVEPA
ncbi:MAG: chemotaxis-specific protein-glutamate methyltransferase CheB [Myxococcota bacterium]|nr:chemotaxis-specific protein-glutamate methyltransferase CheB [Myxococcota bacterium]